MTLQFIVFRLCHTRASLRPFLLIFSFILTIISRVYTITKAGNESNRSKLISALLDLLGIGLAQISV